jgi:hypothetical protein
MTSPGIPGAPHESPPSLQGKTVLLIAPEFFGYAAEIESTLRQWGATVHRYENRPSTSVGMKALVRLFPLLARPACKRYFEAILRRHAEQAIDWILVLRGEALTAAMVERFARAFPRARRVLYLWDSFRHDGRARARMRAFEEVYTFDTEDAVQEPRLRLLPLFYLRRFAALRSQPTDLDLSFVGTVHGDRYRIIHGLRASLDAGKRVLWFMYFPSRWLYRLRRLLDPRMRGGRSEEFSFAPMPAAEVADVYARSATVLDIHREIQSGLTIRTLETLGAQRKLITTNAHICQYDFFDPQNVAVIERRAPVLPEGFLDRPFRPTPPELLEKYSVEHWLRTVLGLIPLSAYLRQPSSPHAP